MLASATPNARGVPDESCSENTQEHAVTRFSRPRRAAPLTEEDAKRMLYPYSHRPLIPKKNAPAQIATARGSAKRNVHANRQLVR